MRLRSIGSIHQVLNGGSTSLQFNTTGCALGNTYQVTIEGSSTGGQTFFVNATLGLQSGAQPSFTIQPSPSIVTVTPGGGDVYTLNVAPSNGFTGAVSFAAGSLPAGASVSCPAGNTVTGSGTVQVRVNTTTAAAVGSRTFSIIGTNTSLGIS